MRYCDEMTNPGSCLNKVEKNELVFVLLGRDPAAPEAIRAWIAERIRLGKNKITDIQIVKAQECAGMMNVERSALLKRLARRAVDEDVFRKVTDVLYTTGCGQDRGICESIAIELLRYCAPRN